MKPAMIAPRLVTWAVILLGSAEVVWVVYLAFTQQQVVRIFHVRLATLGLGAFSAMLCAGAALALVRRSTWAAALGVGAATTLAFLATVGRLTPSLDTSGLLGDAQRPLLVALPGVLAGVYAATTLLRPAVAADPAPSGDPAGWLPAWSSHAAGLRVAAAVLALMALVVTGRMVLHVLTWDSQALATQSRAIIVILDSAETLGLLGAGLASLTGRPRATLVLATVAVSLLLCDAYGNVVMAGSGQAFAAALFYLVVGEIPSIVVCGLALLAAHRHLAATGQLSPAGVAA